MKKSTLSLALAAAFGASPVFGQTVDEKLQVLQQEIDQLKAQQAGKPAPCRPDASS